MIAVYTHIDKLIYIYMYASMDLKSEPAVILSMTKIFK